MTSDFTLKVAGLCKELLSELKGLCSHHGTDQQGNSPTAGLAALTKICQKIRMFIQLSVMLEGPMTKNTLLYEVDRLQSIIDEISPDMYLLVENQNDAVPLQSVDTMRKEFLSVVTTLIGHAKNVVQPDLQLPSPEKYLPVCLKNIRKLTEKVTSGDTQWKELAKYVQ